MTRGRSPKIHLKRPDEVEAIARSGGIISALFQELQSKVVPGTSTRLLDSFVESFILSHDGATPAFKGLYGFPGSACVSINQEVVHGIPLSRKLKAGDIVSIDVGVRLDGWCADSAYTFAVGDISPEASRLLDTTLEALVVAVAAARPGNHIGDIGAVQKKVVAPRGFAIIRDLVGHGIGRNIHEDPQVSNVGSPGGGLPLTEGMVLAVEPMLAAGSGRIETMDDGWTVRTADGSLSAHYEHTVAITSEGPRILTGGGIWDVAPRRAALGARGRAVPSLARTGSGRDDDQRDFGVPGGGSQKNEPVEPVFSRGGEQCKATI